jgi:hypothetical protein
MQLIYTNYFVIAECVVALAALLVALLGGVTILQRRDDGAGKLMGWATLVLFIGYALYLVPKALAGLAGMDNAFLLSAGRMAAAIAVTVFYILLSLLWEKLYEKKNSYYAEMGVRDLSGIRALGCVGPIVLGLVGVMDPEGSIDPLSGVPFYFALIAPAVRCVPLLIVALIVAGNWRKTRDALPTLQSVWWLLLLAAVFGIAADLGMVFVPALELLYLPQLVCLLAIVILFVRFAGETGELH